MYFSTYSSQILFLFYQYATFLSHNLRVWIQSIAPQKDCRQPQDQQQPKQTRSFLQPVYLILWSIEKPLLSLQQIQHLQTVFISSEYKILCSMFVLIDHPHGSKNRKKFRQKLPDVPFLDYRSHLLHPCLQMNRCLNYVSKSPANRLFLEWLQSLLYRFTGISRLTVLCVDKYTNYT